MATMLDEKMHEKEIEKREEKWDEKWHRDPVGSVVGALFLIWLGVVLLASQIGLMDTFTSILTSLSIEPYDLPIDIPFFNLTTWQVFFLGAAAILLVEVIVRLLVPAYRRPLLGSIIGAIVFVSLATGQWNIIGPLIVLAIGLYSLARGLIRRR